MTESALTPRLAVISGAGSGIGQATAWRLAQAGYRLILVDRDAQGMADTAAQVSGDVGIVVADLSRPSSAREPVAEAIGNNDVDLLVNCAGVGWPADAAETTDEVWETTLTVNLTATFYLCQLVLPAMLARGHGVIVNIASAGALVGLRRRVAYCASKAGILGLTRAIAADHAGQGIRINAVCPGTVNSPWINRMVRDDPDPEATRRRMEDRQLDGQMGTPQEVAEWIEFISSDKGRFMNGAALVIDGGLTAV